MIKYLGSKRTLVPLILDTISRIGETRTVLDLFSGTSRVGHALKSSGYRVLANDHNAYAATLAHCYVQADRDDILRDAQMLVREFNSMPGSPGYFTETFCVQSRFFQPKNGARIDAIRESIDARGLPPDLKAVMLVSLMEAADRVDSTTGLQMAYLKTWAPRAYNDLQLRVPEVLPRARNGRGEAFCLDAFDAVERFEADVAYIDPPYNQHSYSATTIFGSPSFDGTNQRCMASHASASTAASGRACSTPGPDFTAPCGHCFSQYRQTSWWSPSTTKGT